MPTDQLVLFKSRSQRLTEMIVMPIAFLPVGPAMRAVLGDKYQVFYGLAAIMLMILLVTRVSSSQWAARHGGEWVTKAEQLRRLVAEAAETPRWPNALATTVMLALILVGFLLTVEPLDHLGGAYGGTFYTILVVTAVSLLGGARVLLGGSSQRQPVIVNEAPPTGYLWSELRTTLPLTYAAYLLAAIIAFAIAAQLQGTPRYLAFVVTVLMTSQLPLILLQRTRKQIYPIALDANLRRQVLDGVLLWGIPMGIIFSALTALDTIGIPSQIALRIAIAMPLGAVGGVAFGILAYAIRRLSESRRAR